MRNLTLFSMMISAFVFLCGCEYSVPAGKPGLPIDNALLGIWENLPGKKDTDQKFRILVLKYSDTEYLVNYFNDKDALYFRAYPVKIDDINAVQIQWIGTDKGALEEKDRKYHLISAVLKDNNLEIKVLNSSLISKDVTNQEELKNKILQNKNNPELFRDPGIFRKLKK